ELLILLSETQQRVMLIGRELRSRRRVVSISLYAVGFEAFDGSLQARSFGGDRVELAPKLGSERAHLVVFFHQSELLLFGERLQPRAVGGLVRAQSFSFRLLLLK